MRRLIWAGTLLACLLITLGAVWAEEAPAAPAPAAQTATPPQTLEQLAAQWGIKLPKALTPDMVAAWAVQRSTDIALARQGVVTAEGYLQQAQALKRLTVDGSASYNRTGPSSSFTFPGSSTPISLSPNETHVETVAVEWPLYQGKRDRFSREVARETIQAASGGVEAAKVSIALAARQAVYAYLRLQQLEVTAQQQVTALAEHLRVTNAMFEAGTAPRFEVVQAETNLAQAKGQAIQAHTAVANVRAQILTLLNLPQGLDFPVEEGVPLSLPEGDLHQLIATAMTQRSEVKAQEAQVRSQEANVRLAGAATNPSLSLSGAVNNQTESLGSSDINWSLSLGLKWPLYDGGMKQGKLTVAQGELQTARLNLEKTMQQIALEVTQAQYDYLDAREALTVAEQGEVNARERARIAQVRFANGVGLGVEVTDAQTALAAAQAQVINARYDLQVAVAALRAAQGLSDLPKEPLG